MGILANKVAVIAGGSSGFGEAIARRFVAEGADVVIAARGQAKLDELAAETGATPLVCDVSDFDSVRELAEAVVERFGRLDIAVNSAGFEDACPIAQLEPERVERMVAVQFTGALYFIQHMANAMGEGGSIISLSSLTGSIAAQGHAPYAGCKAGINHVTTIAAAEYGGKGVRVNTVSPTVIETPMTAHMFAIPGFKDALAESTPLGKLGSVENVVDAVLWFASDASSFITAQNVDVDGGLRLRRIGG